MSGGLSQEQILKLLAKPERSTTSKGKKVDTSDRTITTWFAIQHIMFDDEKNETAKCSNPDCTDHRVASVCARINDVLMCRRCFLSGYKLEHEL